MQVPESGSTMCAVRGIEVSIPRARGDWVAGSRSSMIPRAHGD